MSARPLALLAALACALALGPRPVVAAPTADDAVAASERELQAGLAAYAEGEFAAALEHFERAYELHPSPDYLYAWAQAARSSGDCATAVDLYRRFIDAGATGASLEAARQNEIRCAEQLAAEAEAEAEAPPVAEPEPTAELPPVEDDPPPPPPPRRDRLGLAFVITGGVAAGVGVGLLAVAGARQATQADQTSYQRFDELDPGIDRLYAAGGVTLGVGAALAIAGAIRLGTRSRRASDRRQALVLPTIDAHGTPLVLVRIAAPRAISLFPLR